MGKPARKLDITQFKHKKKKRKNNPSVGLVNSKTEPLKEEKKEYAFDPHISPELCFDSKREKIEKIIENGLSGSPESADKEASEESYKTAYTKAKEALTKLKNLSEPYLNWAGKKERASFEVPTISLHTHERIDPRAVIEQVRKTNTANYEQLSLFKKEGKLPDSSAIDFYRHEKLWKNRLIAGDSLLVMNSLLEKEGMGGQIQCVYIDPPYGIKYGSNFQPFTNKRDVKDKKDEDLTAEPEMLKAFRDTWELGIHSYLSYLRDRLLFTRELLTESGSCFVQISDENVHLVRNLMDEIFGRENFVRQISFRTNSPLGIKLIPEISDYIIWYTKNIENIKFQRLFTEKNKGKDTPFTKVEFPHGERRSLTKDEKKDLSLVPSNAKLFRLSNLFSSGYTPSCTFDFKYKGKNYSSSKGYSWKTNFNGMKKLAKEKRLYGTKNWLNYIQYFDDLPVQAINNNWIDTFTELDKSYIVQTSTRVIERCLLMTTDPGDLVLDPTCGSGTTAYVAEKWGRRWITCDTSRVAITLAKQRLMTAHFDYYKLKNKTEGVSSGFQYKTVPHITLGSIANNEPAKEEVLYDKPLKDKTKARVTGPFTVEAVPSPTVQSLGQSKKISFKYEWLDEVRRSGIKCKNGIATDMDFSQLERLPGFKFLHAEGMTKNPRSVVISFGPEHAPMDKRQVEQALKEMEVKKEKPDILVFASFRFDPEASRLIDGYKSGRTKAIKIEMNMDLQTSDLKKKSSSKESFWLVGSPDVEVKNNSKKDEYIVEVQGFDYYNPATNQIESGGKNKIAMWVLDTDYDGEALFPRQVFFPMESKKGGFAKLAKSLKSEIDQSLIEKYRGTVSLPFKKGKNKKIAVKIIDDRGIESLKILDFPNQKIKGSKKQSNVS